VSDIDVVVVDSLKALDPERPIREERRLSRHRLGSGKLFGRRPRGSGGTLPTAMAALRSRWRSAGPCSNMPAAIRTFTGRW